MNTSVISGIGSVLVLLCSEVAHAQHFDVPAYGFRMAHLEGWTQIPDSAMERALAQVRQTLPFPSRLVGAFQRDSTPPWFQFPYYIVIAHERQWGSLEEALADLGADPSILDALTAEADTSLAKFAFDMSVVDGGVKYDPVTQSLWMTMQSNVPGLGLATTVSASRLAQFGFVQISFYSLDVERDAPVSLLMALIRSLTFDHRLDVEP